MSSRIRHARQHTTSSVVAYCAVAAVFLVSGTVLFGGKMLDALSAKEVPWSATGDSTGQAGAAVQDDTLGDGPVTEPAPPGKTNPVMMARFEAAKKAAAKDGVELVINSSGRTYEEQKDLYAQALEQHGTEKLAQRFVAPPEKSAHTRGLAIDVGPAAGAAWLEEHGAEFGLCRTFENETWHFEPVIAPGGVCPARHPDSSYLWH